MTIAMLLLLSFVTTGGAQAVPMDKWSPYESLNQKAALARDEPSTRALFAEIQLRTLGGPLPQSMLRRLVRAQRDFHAGKRAPITEEALAEAINGLGRQLNPDVYSGTNALQIHLLRTHYLREIKALLASPDRPQADGATDNCMSPAGAVYIGFLLLRQKLANAAWFGDPDTQNKVWMESQASPSSSAETKYQYRVRLEAEPPEETKFRLMLMDLSREDSATTKAFQQFFDALAF